MTATEVRILSHEYDKKFRTKRTKRTKFNDIISKMLMKRSLIVMSDYGSITSAVCMEIKISGAL